MPPTRPPNRRSCDEPAEDERSISTEGEAEEHADVVDGKHAETRCKKREQDQSQSEQIFRKGQRVSGGIKDVCLKK